MFIITRQGQQQFYFELACKQLWDYIAKSSAMTGFYAFALNPNNSRNCPSYCAADHFLLTKDYVEESKAAVMA